MRTLVWLTVLLLVCPLGAMQQERSLQISDHDLLKLPAAVQQQMRAELEQQHYLRFASLANHRVKTTPSCPLIRLSSHGIALIADARQVMICYRNFSRVFPFGASLAAFSPNSHFCVCSDGTQLYVFDLSSLTPEYISQTPDVLLNQLIPEQLSWSYEGSCSIAVDNDGTVLIGTKSSHAYLLSIKNKKITKVNATRCQFGNRDIATVALQGSYALTGSNDRSAYLCSIGYLFNTYTALYGHDNPLKTVAFNSSGTRCLTHSSERVRLWDLTQWFGVSHQELNGHTGSITTAFFSPTDRFVLTGSDDGTIWVWDISNWPSISNKILKVHLGPIYSLSFTHNGQYFLSAADTLRLWDLTAWPKVISRELLTGSFISLASQGNSCLAVEQQGSSFQMHLWWWPAFPENIVDCVKCVQQLKSLVYDPDELSDPKALACPCSIEKFEHFKKAIEQGLNVLAYKAMQYNPGWVTHSDIHDTTALMVAARAGNALMAQKLLERGAPRYAINSESCTALTYADKCGHEEVKKVLLASTVLNKQPN